MSDWRVVTLPDGRVVEYVDARPIESTPDDLVCDVTVVIDGKVAEPIRVTIPTELQQ